MAFFLGSASPLWLLLGVLSKFLHRDISPLESVGDREPYWPNEDDMTEWSAYLDMPHVVQQNRWFLDRCFNLPTVKK